jgi:alpha-L-fucosidase
MYYRSVGHNCNLIIGAVPDMRGLIPEADMSRYVEFGREIRRRFSNPLAETCGEGYSVEVRLPEPGCIDHAVIMEEITHGERVREYVLEGLVPGGRWDVLCEGQSIGHKRIQSFRPIEVSVVRLIIKRATAVPIIRKLQIDGIRGKESRRDVQSA